jgi:hypothetical protein
LVGKHPRCHIRADQTSRRKAGAYSRDGTCTTINPRRICLIARLRQGFDAPGDPSRTQRPTDQTRVHTGIVGRTPTNERWQAEDCGRRMTGTHPKRLGTPTSSLQTDPLPGDAGFQRVGATDFCHLQKTPRNEAVDFNLVGLSLMPPSCKRHGHAFQSDTQKSHRL